MKPASCPGQFHATLARPADLPGRHTDHHGVGLNIFIHHRTGGNKCVFAD
jgi:hypothetical protein